MNVNYVLLYVYVWKVICETGGPVCVCQKHDLENDFVIFLGGAFRGMLLSLACWWPLTIPQ